MSSLRHSRRLLSSAGSHTRVLGSSSPSHFIAVGRDEEDGRRPRATALRRSFHATTQKEYWPLIAGVGIAGVALGIKYLINTSNRIKRRELGLETEEDIQSDEEDQRSTKDLREATDVMGIDLGLYKNCLAVKLVDAEHPTIVVTKDGARSTPAYVSVDTRAFVVGSPARSRSFSHPLSTIMGSHYFIGQDFSEELVAEASKHLTFEAERGPHGELQLILDTEPQSPMFLTELMLEDLMKRGQEVLGKEVQQVSIAVPPYFSEAQRQATFDAAESAGLEVIQLVDDPIAAAEAAEEVGTFPETSSAEEASYLVYDIGGLVFSASVVRRSGGHFSVIATNSTFDVSGKQFDDAIVNHLVISFGRQTGLDLSKDRLALHRLRDAAEKAKIEISTSLTTQVNLPFISADQYGPKHLEVPISRAKYEQLIDKLIARSKEIVGTVLAEAALEMKDIDGVVLVGGGAKTPAIKSMLRQLTGEGKSIGPEDMLQPEEAVAYGACLRAESRQLSGRD